MGINATMLAELPLPAALMQHTELNSEMKNISIVDVKQFHNSLYSIRRKVDEMLEFSYNVVEYRT